MSQVGSKFKWLSVVFIVLTVIFATYSGYLLANPVTTTQTMTQTENQTLTSTMVTSVSSPLYSLNVGYAPSVGFYLTNASGWTLYYLKTDKPNNGTSTCLGQCIENWPAFYTSTLDVPPGLQASSFGEITRPDGSKQTTYNGSPLYYFIKDKHPGDTNGQGVKGVWFAYTLPTPTQVITSTSTSTTNMGDNGGY